MSEVIRVNVSGERFWDISKPIPPVQINPNLNITEIEKKSKECLKYPLS
ncbi:MAG: hypothetical protein N0A00_07820 [Candidatus Bathyarchaeota archaeon]|nr:hypothetical protein [Candidatus Bathyarchaeota archaeon]